jgi:hypothetical protein
MVSEEVGEYLAWRSQVFHASMIVDTLTRVNALATVCAPHHRQPRHTVLSKA